MRLTAPTCERIAMQQRLLIGLAGLFPESCLSLSAEDVCTTGACLCSTDTHVRAITGSRHTFTPDHRLRAIIGLHDCVAKQDLPHPYTLLVAI